MSRRRLLPAIVGLTLVAMATVAVPASAEIDSSEFEELEQRRDELVSRLAELDREVAALRREVDGLDDDLDIGVIEVELLADDLEVAVAGRLEPEATRLEIAISGFIGGDPRRNLLLDELNAIAGSDEPARRRQFYGAVIDNATERLTQIDAQILDLRNGIDDRRRQLDALRDARNAQASLLDDLSQQRAATTLELDEVTTRLDQLRALENRAIYTGLTGFNDPARPALIVKIDNVRAAQPQAGINAADVVFEEEVEGGLTRLAALYHSTGSELVGPVRSIRTSDRDLIIQFNRPLFANSGGNPGALGFLRGAPIIDLGAGKNPELYFRDRSRRAPHNLFLNTFNFWVVGADLDAGSPPPMFTFRDENSAPPSSSRPITGVTIPFGDTTVTYDWNGRGWARGQDGRPIVDADDLEVAPENVVLQFIDYGVSSADPTSPEARTIGSGTAWILTDGELIEGFWRRADGEATTEYVDDVGRQIPLTPGRTWIALARPGVSIAR